MSQAISEKQAIKDVFKNPVFYLLAIFAYMWSNYHWAGHTGIVVTATLFAVILLVLTLIDLKHMILPNIITIPATLIGVPVAAVFLRVGIVNTLLGAVVGFVFFAGIAWVYHKITKRDGLGFGDVKLLAMLGAWTGLMNLPLIVLISSILTLIALPIRKLINGKKGGEPMPYGPFLALAGWLCLLYGPLFWLIIFKLREDLTNYLLQVLA